MNVFKWIIEKFSKKSDSGAELKTPEQVFEDFSFENEDFIIIGDKLEFKSGMTEVSRLFSCSANLDSIKEIILPDTVRTIELAAFQDFKNLETIHLSSTLNSIGRFAFQGTKIKELTIPDSVTEIGEYAFAQCLDLQSVTLSSNISILKSSIFYGCRNLTFVTLPKNLVIIEAEAFTKCNSLKKLKLPESVTGIGKYAFSDCESLEEISFSKNLGKIGDCAFRNCQSLKSIIIPNNLKEIGKNIFDQCCSLTEVNVPENFVEIPSGLFINCYGLKKVILSPYTKTIGKAAFRRCFELKEINFPDGLTEIREEAFKDCKLGKFELPDSVSKLGKDAFDSGEMILSCDHFAEMNYQNNYMAIKEGKLTLDLIKLEKDIREKIQLPDYSSLSSVMEPLLNIFIGNYCESDYNKNRFPIIEICVELFSYSQGRVRNVYSMSISDSFYVTMRTKEFYSKNMDMWIDCLAKHMDENTLEEKEFYLNLLKEKEKNGEYINPINRFEL